MTTNEKGSISPQSETQNKGNHFVSQYKTVYQSFKERPKTTLEVAVETGILRNNITWYVAEMEEDGLIQVVKTGLDPYTRVRVGFYSTDEVLFTKPDVLQLNLFEDAI